MVGLSVDNPWLRGLPAGLKLLALAVASTALFMIADAAVLAAVFLVTAGAMAALGAIDLMRALKPLAYMLAIAFLAHGLLGDWLLGLAVVLRIAVLVLLAALVTASTEMSAMLAVIDRLLAPVRWAGLSTRPVSVAVVMTLRFAPMLAGRWRLLAESWRARSPRRPTWRLIVPFILSALDDADHAATALQARGAFNRR